LIIKDDDKNTTRKETVGILEREYFIGMHDRSKKKLTSIRTNLKMTREEVF